MKIRIHPDNLQDDALERAERDRDLFTRIRSSIDLTEAEMKIVDRRIAEIEAQLAVEGHSFLRSGDYTEAITAFRVASHHQPSLKLTAMTWLTRVAPRTALRLSEPPSQFHPR